MSRDALLVLLALVVLLNLTMLLQAVLVLRRRSSAASEQRRETAALRRRVARRGERAAANVPPAFPAPAPGPRTPFVGPPSPPPAGQPLIAAVDTSAPWARAATAEVRLAATPDVGQTATPDVSQAAAEQPPQPAEATPPAAAEAVTAAVVTAAVVTAEVVTAEPASANQEGPSASEAAAPEAAAPEAAEPAAFAPEPAAPEPVSAEPAPKPQARRSPSARGTPQKSRASRGRRFVLPPLDEDHARSARAIEAFLGGPPEPAATAAERPSRRRHRVRRPAGTPAPKTTLVVSLKGYAELELALGETRATTVAVAFSDALRRSARSTDELRELGGGRLRVIVEADDAGANAYLDRARASTQPWLELLPVPLRLDVGQRKSEIIAFDGARRMAGG